MKKVQTTNVQNSNSNDFKKEKFNDQFLGQKTDQGGTIIFHSNSKKPDKRRPSLNGIYHRKIFQ
jgi:hypothetical protein